MTNLVKNIQNFSILTCIHTHNANAHLYLKKKGEKKLFASQFSMHVIYSTCLICFLFLMFCPVLKNFFSLSFYFSIPVLILNYPLTVQTNPETSTNNQGSKSFTPDITPLILAAHKDNYEIIKILLDRGDSIQEPVRQFILFRMYVKPFMMVKRIRHKNKMTNFRGDFREKFLTLTLLVVVVKMENIIGEFLTLGFDLSLCDF